MSKGHINPRNVNRAFILKDHDMTQDIESDVADFREMVIGSVQAYWSDDFAMGGSAATLEVVGTNNPEVDRWDTVCDSLTDTDTPKKTRLWNLGLIGYRYLKVIYKANGATAGLLNVNCIGKLSR